MSCETELGLIIHENRFTYLQKGLAKIADLGEWWETYSGSAIPLGGIVVNRNLSIENRLLVNDLIRQSTEYAFANRADVMPFVKQYLFYLQRGRLLLMYLTFYAMLYL